MHFQTWQDKAGNTVPLTDVDPVTGASVTFPDLDGRYSAAGVVAVKPDHAGTDRFLSHKLPPCSVIRPIKTNGVAMGAAKGLTASGLFTGQSPDFFRPFTSSRQEADAAQRGIYNRIRA